MHKNEIYSRVGNVIKTSRAAYKLTQKELAEKTGISVISIGKYERGERRPKLEQIIKLAEALNLAPYQLTDGVEFANLSQMDSSIQSNSFLSYLQYIGYLVEINGKYVVLTDVITDSISEGKLLYLTNKDIEEIDNMVSDFARKVIFSKSKSID